MKQNDRFNDGLSTAFGIWLIVRERHPKANAEKLHAEFLAEINIARDGIARRQAASLRRLQGATNKNAIMPRILEANAAQPQRRSRSES